MNTNKEKEIKPELYTMLGCVVITKKHFIEILEQIEKQYTHDIDYCRKMGELLHSHIEPYENHFINNALFKLLQLAFNDDHKDSWLEYFCWELNFGKTYKKDMARRKDGSNIDLSNASKLYDYLNEA